MYRNTNRILPIAALVLLGPVCAAILLSQRAESARSPKKELSKLGISYSPEAFRIVAASGNANAVDLFLRAGMDPDTPGEDGFTALMDAALEGHLTIAGMLMDAGADPEASTSFGHSTLMSACKGGWTELADRLIAAGADPNTQDNHGNTALMFAVIENHTATVQSLLSGGADPNLVTNQSKTSALIAAAGTGNTESLRLLLEAGADTEARETVGEMTPLGIAAFKGQTEAARMLAESGSNLEVEDKNEYTPLMVATHEGHISVVEALIEIGADPNHRSAGGATALFYAAYLGRAEICQRLIDAGADVNARTDKGYTPYYTAKDEGHIAVASALVKAGARPRGLLSRSWKAVSNRSTAYHAGPGWQAIDPFTSATNMAPDLSLLSNDLDSESELTRRALLRRESDGAQMAVIIGNGLEWMLRVTADVESIDARPWIEEGDFDIATADGVPIGGVVGRLPARAPTEPERRHVLAVTEVGPLVLIIDAGGPAETFSKDDMIEFIRGFEFGAPGSGPQISGLDR